MSLDAIGIVCRDLAKSVQFYGHFALDFQEVGGPDHLEAKTSTGLRLMLDSETLMKKLNPKWQRGANTGMVLCFKQEKAESVDKLVAEIVGDGFSVVKDPWDAFWGQRYSSVLDPDGNQVDIFADQ